MNKIKIGFDFDKVFVNYPPFIPDFLIDYFYKTGSGNLEYRFPGALEKNIRILSHLTFLRPPIISNISALKKIYLKNRNTYLISSRYSFLKNRTNNWLKVYPIDKFFKKIYFNYEDEQPHLFKKRVIKKEKIEKFIDDDIDLLIYLSKKIPNVNYYWISNKIFSSSLPKNIKTIKNLNEFLEKYL